MDLSSDVNWSGWLLCMRIQILAREEEGLAPALVVRAGGDGSFPCSMRLESILLSQLRMSLPKIFPQAQSL